MPIQDTANIKEKIISIFRIRGPSLPVHIASRIGLSILFTSAFLSELVSDKKIIISNMRVGSSPVYFIPGQESMLERYSQHLKSKEREAFLLLKEKKILNDKKQEPSIRVALRSIRDFAIPFKRDEDIFWRYFTIKESEIKEIPKTIKIIERKIIPKKIEEKQELNIVNKEKPKKKPVKKKISQKKNEKFFNKVKEFLLKKSIEILDIENFNKDDLTLKIKDNGKEQLLIAYNKKRINESDLIKVHKKSLELNLPYILLTLGETPKKLNELINAIKNLSKIEKLE
ncbi:hypothetical protein CMI39_02005 [Candidatus Pacearchaeota archaeon]|jgi:hypothetical protein|nr:hypothetical protein [Candidatus Pacearchaeota archaeon]|tara:strand:+ start:4917 stop:5771 length:855 start_codon:yes stop_codon:yes gene_type:complete